MGNVYLCSYGALDHISGRSAHRSNPPKKITGCGFLRAVDLIFFRCAHEFSFFNFSVVEALWVILMGNVYLCSYGALDHISGRSAHRSNPQKKITGCGSFGAVDLIFFRCALT